MDASEIIQNIVITTISTTISAIIGGGVKIVFEIIRYRIERERRQEHYTDQASQATTGQSSRSLLTRSSILKFSIFAASIGFVGSLVFTSARPIGLSVGTNNTTNPIATPPRGSLIMDINFDQSGDGNCNDYDRDRLGYKNEKYYIQPELHRAYIAICHEIEETDPYGDLQVSAYPVGNLTPDDTYGYGLLFGWDGGGRSTSEACIAGILRYKGNTFAYFTEVVNGLWKGDYVPVKTIELDTAQHVLRVVLQKDGLAVVILDGQALAEHRFTICRPGPIGISAWNSLGNKVYFDDLSLYALP